MKLDIKIALFLMALIAGKELFAQDHSTYNQLIEEADRYFKVGETGFARIDYEKAVKINPSDEYPRLKLAEIERKEVAQHRIDSLFEQSLVNAEKYFNSGNYQLAQIEYQRALDLEPESVFIKGRLATINNSTSSKARQTKPESNLAGLKAESAKPETNQPSPKTEVPKALSTNISAPPTPLQITLTQAQEFFAAKDYMNAAQRYQTALSMKPGDKAVKSKLIATLALLDKQNKDQKTFNDIIIAAEKAVSQKNTKQAIAGYEQAVRIKPDDAVLQNKLSTLRDKLKVEQDQGKDFTDLITHADQYLHDNNLAEAKKGYEQARTIKPEEKYPQEKLLEINHIEAIAATEKVKKYKETLVLAQSLLNQEDFQGAYQAFNQASELQPQESYPKQKMTELNTKIKELDTQFKTAFNEYISAANKAYQAQNWDIAMDNYLKALRVKSTDTLSSNQISKIISYMDHKSLATLTPASQSISEGKEVKLSFKAIETAKRKNQYLVVRIKNSAAGTPRLYIGYGLDAQKNGGIIYRNLLKGGKYIDYVVRITNQDRWYRLDNNWISLTVEGGSLEIDQLKICADF